jgi:hypothetical protein
MMEKTVKISRLLLSAALGTALAAGAMPSFAYGSRGGHGGHGGHGWHGGHGGHGSHGSVGFYFGVPLAAPYYYPYYSYYPPAYSYYYGAPAYYGEPLAPAAPANYIQRDNAAPPGGYWYYCRDPQGYYPQIRECPTQWEQVPAQPQTR